MNTSGTLVITRQSSYVDRKRAYKVIVNGSSIGQVLDGSDKAFELPAGEHELSVRIDYCETRPMRLSIGPDEHKLFECGPNLDGIKFLIFPWYLTFGRHDYLWLKPK